VTRRLPTSHPQSPRPVLRVFLAIPKNERKPLRVPDLGRRSGFARSAVSNCVFPLGNQPERAPYNAC
jgi:hypothetical protein